MFANITLYGDSHIPPEKTLPNMRPQKSKEVKVNVERRLKTDIRRLTKPAN